MLVTCFDLFPFTCHLFLCSHIAGVSCLPVPTFSGFIFYAVESYFIHFIVRVDLNNCFGSVLRNCV